MHLGRIGLGRMGAPRGSRVLRGGPQGVVFARNPTTVQTLVQEGAVGTASWEEFVARVTPPRGAWVRGPEAVVERTLGDLAVRLQQEDSRIEGGHSPRPSGWSSPLGWASSPLTTFP